MIAAHARRVRRAWTAIHAAQGDYKMAEVFYTVNKPQFRVRLKDMTAPNSVRAYRSSPSDMHVQIRGVEKYASIALSFEEARIFAGMILNAIPEK